MVAGGSKYPASPTTIKNRQHYIKQDGKKVFKFAIKRMSDVSNKLLEDNGLAGKDIVMIGHKNHPEVEGTLGRFPEKSTGNMYLVENLDQAKTVSIKQPENLYLVTQTTLSVSDTEEIISEHKKRFPSLQEPNSEDICYATQNRQDAVKQLALETQLILVVGSENSSISNRFKELV